MTTLQEWQSSLLFLSSHLLPQAEENGQSSENTSFLPGSHLQFHGPSGFDEPVCSSNRKVGGIGELQDFNSRSSFIKEPLEIKVGEVEYRVN